MEYVVAIIESVAITLGIVIGFIVSLILIGDFIIWIDEKLQKKEIEKNEIIKKQEEYDFLIKSSLDRCNELIKTRESKQKIDNDIFKNPSYPNQYFGCGTTSVKMYDIYRDGNLTPKVKRYEEEFKMITIPEVGDVVKFKDPNKGIGEYEVIAYTYTYGMGTTYYLSGLPYPHKADELIIVGNKKQEKSIANDIKKPIRIIL